MGTRNDDISLKLAKAVKSGFLPDVYDHELDILTEEAKKLFGIDSAVALSRNDKGEKFKQKQTFKTGDVVIASGGDSTWNASNEALELWVGTLATANPDLNVVIKNFNTTTQLHDETIVQAGTYPAPGLIFNDLFNRTAGELYNTQPDLGNLWGYDGSSALGDWTIDGSKAVRTADAAGSTLIADGGEAIDSRVTINATIGTQNATGSSIPKRFYFSYQNLTNNMYLQLNVAATTGVVNGVIYKKINNVVTAVVVGSSGILAANNVGVLTELILVKEGTTVSASVNGTVLAGTLTAEDITALAGGAKSGFSGAKLGDEILDIKIESLTSLPPRKLTLWNNCVSGSKFEYQQERLALMYPEEPDLLILNGGHNYGSSSSEVFEKAMDSFISDFRAKWPNSGIVLSSQNPQKSPAINRIFHFNRQASLKNYCIRRGYGYIPGAEAFYAQANNGLDMVSTDGIHPIQTGNDLWRDSLVTYFNNL